MIFWKRPASEAVTGFIERQSGQDWSYPGIGKTRTSAAPRGFVSDHYRIRLGEGDAAFEAACEAIRCWAMFDVGWASVVPELDPPGEGQTVAILFEILGCWWLNACRVVYLIDEDGPPRRFGFAYGPLPDNVERGEERF